MTSTRHLIPDDLYQEFESLSTALNYKSKGQKSKWFLLRKLLAYCKEHPDIFRS